MQNMQGRKNEARKEYADASFARHNGSWALEVLKRETLYTWGTATKDGEKKREREHSGHTEGSRHLNLNLHSNMKNGDEEGDT